jgi:TatA/E family protein of Tat protein translocase
MKARLTLSALNLKPWAVVDMNIGIQELAIIFLVALLLFGPRRLPEIARLLSKIVREAHKAFDEIKREIGDDGKFEG